MSQTAGDEGIRLLSGMSREELISENKQWGEPQCIQPQ